MTTRKTRVRQHVIADMSLHHLAFLIVSCDLGKRGVAELTCGFRRGGMQGLRDLPAAVFCPGRHLIRYNDRGLG
jgi:hypothetical protein